MSPPINRLRHLNIIVPAGTRTGMVPVDVYWRGAPLFRNALARVIPPGARVPRVCSVTDGVNLLSVNRIERGMVKVVMEEVAEPRSLRARVSGQDAEVSYFCVNPLHERYEFDFQLPRGTADGLVPVELTLGDRAFAPVMVEVESSPTT